MHSADGTSVWKLFCMLQAQACLKLLPDSATAAAELAFVQGVERLQKYGISLSPTELFKVRIMRCHAALVLCSSCLSISPRPSDGRLQG